MPLPTTGQVPFRFAMAYEGNRSCCAHEVQLARERGSVTSKSNYILPKGWERGLRTSIHFFKLKSFETIQSL